MSDAEELISYLSNLRRGYDRFEFSERVKELGALVDSSPLAPDDFDKLFRIWLQLEIPVSTWMSIGSCLVPVEPVTTSLLSFAARWLLTGVHSEVSVSRIGYVLNWLSAALDHNLVDAQDIDKYYVIFHTIFQYDRYANHAAKLLYTLTKPTDVTRAWTQLLISLLHRRQTSRDKTQITALLSLYKSYRPECVPENVAAVSVHNAFPKVNVTLLKRFGRMRDYLNAVDSACHLKWRTHLSEKGALGRGHKVRRLVPDMEFINIGSELYSETSSKNFLHFKDGVKVLAYALRSRTPRPAQLLSLLCNETGLVLLRACPQHHAFLSHDLSHLLESCFLRPDPWHQYAEKADLLLRVGRLQQSLLQAVPVVSRFLVDYLPTWNGCHYFEEILSLLEWLEPESVDELRSHILRPLRLLLHTTPPLTQLAIMRTLTTMYANMAYTRTRQNNFFLNTAPREDHVEMLAAIEEFIQKVCLGSLRRYPGNSIVLHSVLLAHCRLARSQLAHSPACTVLPPCAAAAALAAPSAHALHTLATLLLLERKVYAKMRRRNKCDSEEHAELLTSYKQDIVNCLLKGRALTNRTDGVLLKMLPENRADELLGTFKDVDQAYTLGRHVALAPYTFARCEGVDTKRVSNEAWLEHVVKPQFKDIGALLEKTGRKTEVY